MAQEETEPLLKKKKNSFFVVFVEVSLTSVRFST